MVSLTHNLSPLAQVHASKAKKTRQRVLALSEKDRQIALELLSQDKPYKFVDAPEFSKSNFENIFDQVIDMSHAKAAWNVIFSRLSMPGVQIGRIVIPEEKHFIFTKEQEVIAFKQYHYARKKVAKYLELAKERKLTDAQLRLMVRWHKTMLVVGDHIATANYGLIIFVIKRYFTKSPLEMGDMIQYGNMALVRAMVGFDFKRKFKFSTYACNAIMRELSKACGKSNKDRFQNVTDELGNVHTIHRAMSYEDAWIRPHEALIDNDTTAHNEMLDHLKMALQKNKANLSAIERQIINLRFGLIDDNEKLSREETERRVEGMTLDQVGRVVGVTKERIRQIQNTVLAKLATVLNPSSPENN